MVIYRDFVKYRFLNKVISRTLSSHYNIYVMCYREDQQNSTQLAQKPLPLYLQEFTWLHATYKKMMQCKRARSHGNEKTSQRYNDITHGIKIHSRSVRFKGLADSFMSLGKRTSKDCGLPSFPMSASPSRPCNPFHHDHQIYYSLSLSHSQCVAGAHIRWLNHWKKKETHVDMIWDGSSLYFVGLKEI